MRRDNLASKRAASFLRGAAMAVDRACFQARRAVERTQIGNSDVRSFALWFELRR